MEGLSTKIALLRGPATAPGTTGARWAGMLVCAIDAAFGPCTRGETVYGQRLMRCLHANMIVLLDRGFASNTFLNAVAGTSADFLARLSAARRPPVLHRYGDGSFLSQIGLVKVRIIECEITIATAAGRQTGACRLATTLLNPNRYPHSSSSGSTTSGGCDTKSLGASGTRRRRTG